MRVKDLINKLKKFDGEKKVILEYGETTGSPTEVTEEEEGILIC